MEFTEYCICVWEREKEKIREKATTLLTKIFNKKVSVNYFFLLYVTNKKEINCEIKKSSLLSTN